uniref:mRNA (guanine-N(7)-)-methyltransferase n=1 Tax=Macrostomum lignano TaxID=282301 RepID=A0A1I8FT15_9PLAT
MLPPERAVKIGLGDTNDALRKLLLGGIQILESLPLVQYDEVHAEPGNAADNRDGRSQMTVFAIACWGSGAPAAGPGEASRVRYANHSHADWLSVTAAASDYLRRGLRRACADVDAELGARPPAPSGISLRAAIGRRLRSGCPNSWPLLDAACDLRVLGPERLTRRLGLRDIMAASSEASSETRADQLAPESDSGEEADVGAGDELVPAPAGLLNVRTANLLYTAAYSLCASVLPDWGASDPAQQAAVLIANFAMHACGTLPFYDLGIRIKRLPHRPDHFSDIACQRAVKIGLATPNDALRKLLRRHPNFESLPLVAVTTRCPDGCGATAIYVGDSASLRRRRRGARRGRQHRRAISLRAAIARRPGRAVRTAGRAGRGLRPAGSGAKSGSLEGWGLRDIMAASSEASADQLAPESDSGEEADVGAGDDRAGGSANVRLPTFVHRSLVSEARTRAYQAHLRSRGIPCWADFLSRRIDWGRGRDQLAPSEVDVACGPGTGLDRALHLHCLARQQQLLVALSRPPGVRAACRPALQRPATGVLRGWRRRQCLK